MTTLAELVAQTPAPTRGAAVQLVDGPGVWRHVLELADPAAGSGVVWYDLTDRFAGYEYTRGAQSYQGRYRASVATVDLYAPGDDSLAPWNDDTSPTFGVHVSLGPGLLLRSGLIRVLDAAVVEWNPRFTCKVEYWGDAAYAQGKVRQHRVIARDTSTSLVGVPLPASIEHNWSDRIYDILTNSGWAYGSLVYGAQFTDPGGVPILLLPERPAVSSAINELDVACDPAGLVWYTNRYGQLVVRPAVSDTFHADAFVLGATGDELPTRLPVGFAWWACDDEAPTVAAYAVDAINPFGLDRTETAVINHVKISDPVTAGFDDDDPISIQRYDRHTFQASWQAANDVVAAGILSARAFADVEAAPLQTSVDLPGFHTGPDSVDYLEPVTLVHQNRDGGLQVTAAGWLRYYREQVAPRGCDIDWALTITIDVAADGHASTVGLLPVEDLTLVDVTDTEVEVSWTNPAQTVTPTHTQIRLINPASLWATIAYPSFGAIWHALEPETGYEFQVRLIRVVDGLVTHVSPTRSLAFTTDPTTVPDVDVDDGNIDVTLPFPDCDDPSLEWVLQSSPDASTWTTELSGTILEAPWEVSIPDFPFVANEYYRIGSRDICAGVPGPWVYSNLFVGLCADPPAVVTVPFDDPAIRFYLPGICPTDTVVEAISEDAVTKGPQFADFTTDGDGNIVLVSAGEGLVVYGANPHLSFTAGLDGLVGDTTIAVKVLITHQPDGELTLFGAAGLWIDAEATGALWRIRARAHEAGGPIVTSAASAALNFGAWYDLAITHDADSGEMILYVDGNDQVTVSGLGVRHNPGVYELELPEGSLVTNAAVWGRVLADDELPGFVPPVTVTINKAAGQADPTAATPILFTVVFSEAVTGFATGDVTISGSANPTTAVVTGSGTTYTVTVSGMTVAGTVVASIPAGVATGSGGVLNDASTSTDNTVAYTAFNPLTDLTNLDIWIAGYNRTLGVGSNVDTMPNMAAGGGNMVLGGRAGVVPLTTGPTINGHNTVHAGGNATMVWSVGRWLSDDIYDIFVVVKGVVQTNRTIIGQHKGTTDVGRTVFGTGATDSSKARTFFNNGASWSGESTATALDNTTAHVIRYYSAGAGDHYIQIDGGTPTLVITGQTVTPFNTKLHLFTTGGDTGESVPSDGFVGEFCEAYLCDAVQSAPVAAAACAHLKAYWGIPVMSDFGDDEPEDAWDIDDPPGVQLDNLLRRLLVLRSDLLARAVTDRDRRRIADLIDDLRTVRGRV